MQVLVFVVWKHDLSTITIIVRVVTGLNISYCCWNNQITAFNIDKHVSR